MKPALLNPGSQYSQMALYNCYEAFENGKYSPRLVKNILRYKKGSIIDVDCMEDFLDSENEMIQRASIEIIGERGNPRLLLDMERYISSENRLLAIKYVLRHEELADEIMGVLQTEDRRELLQAMQLFRESGNVNPLLILSFTDDNYIRNMASKFICEKEENKQNVE